jgi:hypothetical protein
MTVCTASLFYWNYSQEGGNDWGPAFVVASDRMLTDTGLEIEYESSRAKAQIFGQRHIVFVAGDIPLATEALQLAADVFSDAKERTTSEIANTVGWAFERVRRTWAAKRYLAPLNLTEDIFANQQGEPSSFVQGLADKMQAAHYEAEAMVLGCDADSVGLFRVDSYGVVTNHFNIGFLSIGVGGIHASAQFMNEPYNHQKNYYNALYSTFVAKKRGEVAPGVGAITDMFMVSKNGITFVPDQLVLRMETLYRSQRVLMRRAAERAAQKIVQEEQKVSPAQSAELPNDPISN